MRVQRIWTSRFGLASPWTRSFRLELNVIHALIIEHLSMRKHICRIVAVAFALTTAASRAEIDFSREILPLFSDKCFQCHGPDPKARQSGLRLDEEKNVKMDRDGYAVVVPGASSRSELMKRLLTEDSDEKMPPAELGRFLSAEEISKIKQWIDEGAKWGPHWSLTPIRKSELPNAKANPVDAFINRTLETEGLKPQVRATRETLIRRLHLDMTGLPPSLKEIDAFLGDEESGAWKRAIRRALAKPGYGERMAWDWLDAARYADSNGYQGDSERTMWPWRDWVIDAFNNNFPWDKFTIWQLAGDLLPNATFKTRLATGFNRNHMINGEGGRIAEENRVDYVMDMAETTGTIWLGMTFNCSRCHDHKFDPITQKDYYSLFAFFNQTPVTGSGRNPQTAPIITAPTPANRAAMAKTRKEIASLEKQLGQRARELARAQAAWETNKLDEGKLSPWKALKPVSAKADNQTLKILSNASILVSGKNPNNDTYRVSTKAGGTIHGIRLEALKHSSLFKGSISRSSSGNFVLTSFELRVGDPNSKPVKFSKAEATFEQGGLKIARTLDGDKKTGWGVWDGRIVDREHIAVFTLAEPLKLDKDTQLLFTLRHDSQYKQHLIGCFRLSTTDAPKPQIGSGSDELLAALSVPKAERNKAQANRVAIAHRNSDPAYGKLKNQIESKRNRVAAMEKSAPKVMVMKDMPKPRETFMLTRGLYNKPGQKVSAAVPAFLPKLPKGAKANRLGLAQWLTSAENPLAARVTVNRFWQMIFGIGIVKTAEDFGVQAEYPKHPELLDWLAAEFIESGWDVKHLLELILSSEAYRRSSDVTAELLERDPENRFLARGARFRMPSWMIRDQALAASGLINSAIGGAPVNTYQPEGIWEEATFGRKKYKQDSGDKLYRRSIYVFWRRIIGPTMFFDSGARQVCTVKTPRTNTPLHALATLNDITYVEAARAMAQRVLTATGGKASDSDRLRHASRLVLSRSPGEQELKIWKRGLDRARAQFKSDEEALEEFLNVGESKRDENLDKLEHAALASVCLGLLNLDEALTKE